MFRSIAACRKPIGNFQRTMGRSQSSPKCCIVAWSITFAAGIPERMETKSCDTYYLGALQLELQLFPIQDPANVARFLAMLDELGADAIAELIQRIHPIEVVMPQQNT
jgi:hypothetical protein